MSSELCKEWHDLQGCQDVQLAVDYIAELEADKSHLLSVIELLREDCDRLRKELDDCNGVIR